MCRDCQNLRWLRQSLLIDKVVQMIVQLRYHGGCYEKIIISIL